MVLNFKPLSQTIFNNIELDFFSIQGLNFFNIGSSGVFTCQGEVDHTPEESETSYWLGHNNSRHFGQGSSTNSFLC